MRKGLIVSAHNKDLLKEARMRIVEDKLKGGFAAKTIDVMKS